MVENLQANLHVRSGCQRRKTGRTLRLNAEIQPVGLFCFLFFFKMFEVPADQNERLKDQDRVLNP